MIIIDSISKQYDEKKELYANKNVCMKFESGLYSIVGKSGSGKSTLLHIMGGLLKPTCGKVIIDDVDIYALGDKKLSEFRNKNIGFVFQNFYLEDTYTSYENVELPLIISKEKERKEKVEKALENFDVLDKKNDLAMNLSGGEKQRVAIARAIINNPKILLCDEPTGNLDETNGKIVFDYLRKMASSGILVIIVTHNLEIAKASDKVFTLKDGQVVENDI